MYRYLLFLLSILSFSLYSCTEQGQEADIPTPQMSFSDEWNADYSVVTGTCTVTGNVSVDKLIVEYSTDESLASAQKAFFSKTGEGYSVSIEGLQPQTTYYYRYTVKNKISTYVDQKIRQFRTRDCSDPIITTLAATSISGTQATLTSRLEETGGKPVKEQGFLVGTDPASLEQRPGAASLKVEGLSFGTRYYYQAYATSEVGMGLGELKEFTTLRAVSFKEVKVSDITATSTYVTGGIADDGGVPVEEQGFRLQEADKTEFSFIKSEGTATLSSLKPNVKYKVWYYARTFESRFESEAVEFETQSGVVTIVTGEPENVTSTTALLKGTVSTDGGSAITERGFLYGKDEDVEKKGTKQAVSGTTGEYQYSLGNLTANTKYYVKAYAKNAQGTYYGGLRSFVTSSIAVSSITLDKSTLSLTAGGTATLTATVKPDDATDKTVTWSTSDASIATVDNGKVTALKEGSATITAKAGEKTATCSVTVQKNVVAVTSITLNKTSLSLNKGESATLSATVSPSNATDKTVTWSSSNASVASVDQNGKVTAVNGGTATITAKAGEKSATCIVTVTVPVTSVSLSQTSLTLEMGQQATLTATVLPSDASNKTVTWSSSNASVATVKSGVVTAVKEGQATITAKAGEKSATCKVTVTSSNDAPEAVDLGLSVKWASFNVGATKPEEYGDYYAWGETSPKSVYSWETYKWCNGSSTTLTKYNNEDKKTRLDMSDDAARVNWGGEWRMPTEIEWTELLENCTWTSAWRQGGIGGYEVTSKKNGNSIFLPAAFHGSRSGAYWSSSRPSSFVFASTLIFNVDYYDDFRNSMSTRENGLSVRPVYGDIIPVSSISLDRTSLSLPVGGSAALSATVSPSNATDRAVEWTTSDYAVASVDEMGQVKAWRLGTATITATAGGKTATCEVSVIVPVEDVILDRETITLKEGQSTTLLVSVKPDNATNKAVTWSSSNPSVATVTNGFVTAVKEGNATITATAGDKSGRCVVTVSNTNTGSPEAVDLGLSVKWASCNVGAPSMEEYGDYFAWGETSSKNKYDWNTYKWSNGGETNLTKYNYSSSYGSVDYKTYLDLSDDAARVKWGGKWRIPTDAEWTELRTKCTWTWTTKNGVNGYTVIGPNGNAIFLPASGFRIVEMPYSVGSIGIYMSSSLKTDNPQWVWWTAFASSDVSRSNGSRTLGHSVRPVYGDLILVSGLSLDRTSLSLTVGNSATLSATITPSNATDKTVAWTSSNTSVATVDTNGQVTAKAEGTATITAIAGGKTATCKVTVTVPVTSVSLSQTSLTLEMGQQATLTATVLPSDASNKTVTWSSSNASVATVKSGVVTAVREGQATITAIAGGKSATCNVIVCPVYDFHVNGSEGTFDNSYFIFNQASPPTQYPNPIGVSGFNGTTTIQWTNDTIYANFGDKNTFHTNYVFNAMNVGSPGYAAYNYANNTGELGTVTEIVIANPTTGATHIINWTISADEARAVASRISAPREITRHCSYSNNGVEIIISLKIKIAPSY